MVKVTSFKMPFESKKFNKNQRVWLVYGTGDLAALVFGKFRGSGRYVKAWVNWSSNQKTPPVFQEFEVEEEFAKRFILT